jgi:hypothetical protein
MSQEMEVTLRKSLDEVDRIRRRQIVGAAIVLLLFLLDLGSVIVTLHKVGVDTDPRVTLIIRVTLITNVELMVFTVAFCSFVVCLYITRMTSKILKAIEYSSRS